MSDSTVKIANLPDAGSPQAVAFKLMVYLHNSDPKPVGRAAFLDLYAECLHAAHGQRDWSGK